MSALVADPAWRAQVRPEGLVVYAGADLAYLIPDVPSADATALAELFEPVLRGPARPLDPDRLAAPVRLHLPQLRSLGALRPAGLPTADDPRPLAVGVRVVGADPAGLAGHFPGHVPGHAPGHVSGHELVLVVRTTGTLLDLVDVARELTVPHLLLDLAYHHTASLGPFVVPGASACLSCLAVRTARRWGDPEPPFRPAAADRPELPFAWAAQAIARIGAGSLALLDRVVTLHLDEFTTTAEDVLPSVDCEVCPRPDIGRVDLPWGKTDDDQSDTESAALT